LAERRSTELRCRKSNRQVITNQSIIKNAAIGPLYTTPKRKKKNEELTELEEEVGKIQQSEPPNLKHGSINAAHAPHTTATKQKTEELQCSTEGGGGETLTRR
jgi:hypothetical protein